MVVAEGKLVEVRRQMLPRNRVVSPVQGAFKLAPKSLNGVGVEHTFDVLPLTVIRGAVGVSRRSDLVVARKLVRGDCCPFLNAGLNQRHNGLALNVRHDFGPDIAPALDHAENGGLASRPAPTLPLALAADIRFVGLNDADQSLPVAFHEKSNLLGDPPSALVGYSKLALKLFGRDSVLGLAHKVDGMEPKSKGRRALVKDRAFRGIDLMATGASVGAAMLHGVKVLFAALLALQAVVISILEDVCQTSLVIREVFAEVLDRVFRFHALSLTDSLLVVKG